MAEIGEEISTEPKFECGVVSIEGNIKLTAKRIWNLYYVFVETTCCLAVSKKGYYEIDASKNWKYDV